jgi:ubiquinone/menaquinone biosynthesis C-methylase UbiE
MNEAHMAFCPSEEWRQMLEELVIPPALDGVDLGDDVLEIGPGPGFVTDVLRERVARITAVESDPVLYEPLAERLADTNVDVVLGDASELDLPDDRFSSAASFNMLHHVPTAELQNRIFSELQRVLQPGGVVVVVDGTQHTSSAEFHEGDTLNPIETADAAGRLEAAGFTDIAVREFDLGWIATARA